MLETPCVGLRGWGRTGRCHPRVPRQPSQLLALVWQQGAQRDVPVPGVTPGRPRRGTCASSERGPVPVPCARSSTRHGHSFTVLASRERRAPPRLQRCTPTSRRPPPRTHMHVASLTTEGPLRLRERSTFSKAGRSRGWGCRGTYTPDTGTQRKQARPSFPGHAPGHHHRALWCCRQSLLSRYLWGQGRTPPCGPKEQEVAQKFRGVASSVWGPVSCTRPRGLFLQRPVRQVLGGQASLGPRPCPLKRSSHPAGGAAPGPGER